MWLMLISTVVKFVLFALVMTLGLSAVLTLMERKQSAYSQDRVGPQRAHFFKLFGKPFVLLGLLHIAADSVKMFFKETHQPRSADTWLYRVAPLIGFVTSIVILALIPFGPTWQSPWGEIPLQIASGIDAGLIYVLAIGSLGIYGAALAGWSSNNRFALLGGMRAGAQTVSYEVALGLTIVGVIIAYGTLQPENIVAAQAGITHGFLPNWGIFVQPLGATLFFIAAIAETKRAPFDMPEGESEIIGYFVEYSSMGFGMFMLGEFIEIVVLACLFVTLFLGGWHMPYIIGESSVYLGFWSTSIPWVHALAGMVIFFIKVIIVSLLQLQIRWTLPRVRYDQLMRIGWKQILPLALINIFLTAGLVWWDPTLGLLGHVGGAMIILFILVVIAGPRGAHRQPVAGH